jgi:hypothetical protein
VATDGLVPDAVSLLVAPAGAAGAAAGGVDTQMVNGTLDVFALTSVTVTVKPNVPFAVGVPEMIPVLGAKESPVGSAPAVTVQLNGPVPPDFASVWL